MNLNHANQKGGKSMDVTGLKNRLERLEKNGFGDVTIIVAVDAEGNGYADIDFLEHHTEMPLYDEECQNVIVVWPSHKTYTI